MTTLIPLSTAVQQDLSTLDADVEAIALGFIGLLKIDTERGQPFTTGRLGDHEARRVYFDRGDYPMRDQFSSKRRTRSVDARSEGGRAYRILYKAHKLVHQGEEHTLIEVLSVGRGHGAVNAQTVAEDRLRAR